MHHRHTIVWLDHYQAILVGISKGRTESKEVHSDRENTQIHRMSGPRGSGHAPDDVVFFDRVADELEDVDLVLVTGPGIAKTAFVRRVEDQRPVLAKRIVGVETLDHPTPGELKTIGTDYFRKVDQLNAS